MNEATRVNRPGSGLLFALRGWSRGCAALARREFARALGRKRLSPEDFAAFSAACAAARTPASVALVVASLLLAARPANARAGDILRGGAQATRPVGTQQHADTLAARQRQADQARRAQDALSRATLAIQAIQTAQNAARIAAQNAASSIPNGLGAGGLRVASGVPADASLWQNAKAPTQAVSGNQTQVSIVQTAPKAILTWDEFNVGKNTEVYFNQTAGGADAKQWIALNRITDATLNPSKIHGSIRAEGQVYLINPNGVLFGGSSQVNVHTLLASGLDFKGETVAARNATFERGLASDDTRANYTMGVDSGSDRPVGDVTVESGARLFADESGTLYLFGKNVTNSGALSAPGGQVGIAAGERVWVSKNWLGHRIGSSNPQIETDPSLRGVRLSVQDGGVATNVGVAESARGNVTLTGKRVVNDGALLATTSPTNNGSVTLIAGDAANEDPLFWMFPTNFGSLNLGSASVISIAPDSADETGFSSQFLPSQASLYAHDITFQTGSTLYAPGATAYVVAKTQSASADSSNDTSFIDIRAGALLSLAGLMNVPIAMESNTIEAELRLDELKDAPIQRDGPLRGEKISIDIRRGTTFADVSGYYDLIEQTAPQSMTSGGALKLDSGAVVTRVGSTVDISGGSLRYADGYVSVTRLLGHDGSIRDITTASPNIRYAGVYDTYRRSESGYAEGKAAGSLILGAQSFFRSPTGTVSVVENLNPLASGVRPYFTAFSGAMFAGTAPGPYQRENPAGAAPTPQTAWRQAPKSASLVSGYVDPANGIFGPNVTVGATTPLSPDYSPAAGVDPERPHTLELPAAFFDGNTFGHVSLLSGAGGGTLSVPAGTTVNLGAFGSFDFRGARIDIDGRMVAPGGRVSLVADLAKGFRESSLAFVPWGAPGSANRPGARFGGTSLIDVAGTWINEILNPGVEVLQVLDGGAILIETSGDVSFSPGATLKADGGGRMLKTVLVGRGGSISLRNNLLSGIDSGFGATPLSPDGSFDVSSAKFTARALSGGAGGSLKIETARPVKIGEGIESGVSATDTMYFARGFFSENGFASYAVASSRSLEIGPGVSIAPVVEKHLVDAKLSSLETGGDLSSRATSGVLPFVARETMSFSLSSGDAQVAPLLVGTGSVVMLHPGSSIHLHATGQIFADGMIEAPGGVIVIDVNPLADGFGVRLGSGARLLAPGYLSVAPNAFATRSVESGGRVEIMLSSTTTLSSFFLADPDSVIDVSGVSGVADQKTASGDLLGARVVYRAVEIPGNAGSVAVLAFGGGSLAGTLRLDAGGAGAARGSLAVSAGDIAGRPGAFISLKSEGFASIAADTPNPTLANAFEVNARSLEGSGLGNLFFEAFGGIAFSGDTTLAAGRSITLRTPVIGLTPAAGSSSSVSISAPYVSFGPVASQGLDPALLPSVIPSAPASATGSLYVSAKLIDFEQMLDLGGSSLRGFADARFVSSGDIRLTPGIINIARLHSVGALTLESAQTYVTATDSASSPRAFTVRSDKSVSFFGNGGAAPAPYAFGGVLNVEAPDIVQGGILKAPFGRINLTASNSLTLSPGSETSVSLGGVTASYGAAPGGFFGGDFGQLSTPGAIPSAAISLSGKDVFVQSGAVVDVSGGGDLFAYEFVPGNGGSSDVLNTPGVFAVLPGYKLAAAPVIPENAGLNPATQIAYRSTAGLRSSALRAGDMIRLSGVNGLADGDYTLLPGHYALLAGGVAIRRLDSGYASAGAASTLPDGSQIVFGRRIVAGTIVTEQSESRFAALSGEVIRARSQFNEYLFSESVTKLALDADHLPPRLPRDAGVLTISASRSLELEGSGRFDAAPGGLLGGVDIAALKIALLGAGESAPDDSYLGLDATQFTNFGIGSLLLGGTRSQDGDGVAVNVIATDIFVANAADSPLVISEAIFAATNTVTLAQDSVLRAEGAAVASQPLALVGDGVLVRLSTGNREVITRTGASGVAGDLIIGERVSLAAAGSIALDGTRSITTGAGFALAAPNLDLSGAKVSLGSVPVGITGLVLSGATLEALSASRNLLVRSYGTIDFYGPVSLGSFGSGGRPVIESLTLDSAGLAGYGAAEDTVSVTARALTLSNSAGASVGASPSGAGSLRLASDSLTLGPGVTSLAGFDGVAFDLGALAVSGEGLLSTAADLSVSAGLVTASAKSDYAITSTGAVVFTSRAGVSAPEILSGGRLSITGKNVRVGTRFDLPAGILEISSAGGDLTVASGATLATRGIATTFFDITKNSPGGVIRLNAEGGRLNIISGAKLDVSGVAGDGGQIALSASASAVVDGSLLGAGGAFSLDAGSSGPLPALMAALSAGDFTGARSIRIRTGGLSLGAGEKIVAKEVSLRADAGSLDVAGDIIATNAVVLAAGTDVKVRAGASVSAGKDIFITSGSGDLAVESGAAVTTPASLILSAARAGSDVKIMTLAGRLSSGETVVRGRADHDFSATGSVATADYAAMLAEADAWMMNAAAISTRIGVTGVEIRPEIRAFSSGDLIVANDLDLHEARYGATPGAIRFAAGGALTINGSISDGFSASSASSGLLLSGRSWDIALESGGDTTLAAGKLIRTGTGDIRLEVGRDFILTDTQSVIYTAGRKTADETGFVAGARSGDHPINGGDLSLLAGRDIIAPVTRDFVTGWLFRYGLADTTDGLAVSQAKVSSQTSWSVVFKNFEQGLATLGGGDIRVSAGRDIRDLAVMLPTTAQMTSPVGTVAADANILVRGGGDLLMTAGRNIYGGVTMLGRGDAELVSGGTLSADVQTRQRTKLSVATPSDEVLFTSRDLHALFALMDATLSIQARAGVQVEAVVDPMMVPEVLENIGRSPSARNTFFFSGSARTAFEAESAAGDVVYLNNPWAAADLTRSNAEARSLLPFMNAPETLASGSVYASTDLLYAPRSIRMIAHSGDVGLLDLFPGSDVPYAFRLAPSRDGNLELIAGGDVVSELPVTMMDIADEYVRTALMPFRNEQKASLRIASSAVPGVATNYGRGDAPLHLEDALTVKIYAKDGSVVGRGSGVTEKFTVSLPKSASVRSGRDIVNFSLAAQNNTADSITVVSAARDITAVDIVLLGEGEALVEAGRHLSLKTNDPAGIKSSGNVGSSVGTMGGSVRREVEYANLALPNKAASVTISAGAAGVNFPGFAAAYLDPSNAAGVVRTYLPELREYMSGLGHPVSGDAALLAAFAALPVDSQKPFLYDVYFSELRETGLDVTNPESPRFGSYRRGFAAAALFFPDKTATGNINFFGKPVLTAAGGDIRVLAPHGKIVVDEVTNPISGTGVVTRNGGAISFMAAGDIALGNSRVFTLQGGNLLMWTSVGNITAGAGSKTNAVPPKLTYVIDNDANTLLNTTGLQTGSGIGVLDAGTGPVKSRLDLIAPVGTVDAGDAGIRSAGDLNIAALTVIGANNISVSGSSTGVPAAAAPNIGALAAASTTSAASNAGAQQAAEERRKGAQSEGDATPSIYTVKVLDYGDAGEDEERAKRRVSSPPSGEGAATVAVR